MSFARTENHPPGQLGHDRHRLLAVGDRRHIAVPDCGGGDESYGMLSADWTPKVGGDPRLQMLMAHGLLPRL